MPTFKPAPNPRNCLAALLTAGTGFGLFLAPLASAGSYQIITLDSPRGFPTTPHGINNSRVVAGYDIDPTTSDSAGLIYSGGSWNVVMKPGAVDTEFYQINNAGVTAGAYYASDQIYHAFTYDTASGTYTNLPDIPGAAQNDAAGINNKGLVVGAYYDANSVGYPWIYDGSHYTFFTPPAANPAQGALAYNINDAGQVVGLYTDATGTIIHGYVRNADGSFTNLDDPLANGKDAAGNSGTVAYGINNSGVVAGFYIAAGQRNGFLWTNGSFSTFDVDVPGATGTAITGINDQGDLIGLYTDAAGNQHGFEALVPEPTSTSLAVCCGLLLVRRRRHMKE